MFKKNQDMKSVIECDNVKNVLRTKNIIYKMY